MSITLPFTMSCKRARELLENCDSLFSSCLPLAFWKCGGCSCRIHQANGVSSSSTSARHRLAESLWIARWMIYSKSHGQELAISLGLSNALFKYITHQSIRQPAKELRDSSTFKSVTQWLAACTTCPRLQGHGGRQFILCHSQYFFFSFSVCTSEIDLLLSAD